MFCKTMLIFILVQTLHFRASIDMEENQVKEEEERQRTTDAPAGDGEEGFDLNELSALLCELDAVATQVGDVFWVDTDNHVTVSLNHV